MSKSRPTYGPLHRDPTGRRHLLLSQSAAALAESSGFSDSAGESAEIWIVGTSASQSETAVSAAGDAALAHRQFQSQSDMFKALEERLRTETMGLRLYGAGAETSE